MIPDPADVSIFTTKRADISPEGRPIRISPPHSLATWGYAPESGRGAGQRARREWCRRRWGGRGRSCRGRQRSRWRRRWRGRVGSWWNPAHGEPCRTGTRSTPSRPPPICTWSPPATSASVTAASGNQGGGPSNTPASPRWMIQKQGVGGGLGIWD